MEKQIDFLFIHIPKKSSYYKPMDEFLFINYIPMGIFAMADILNKNNINTRIIHLGLENILNENFSIINFIKENNIKNIGISLHWHYQSFDVIYVSNLIKENCKDTKIVLGGLTASRFAEEILTEYSSIDFIIQGDGEVGIVELVFALQNNAVDFSNISNCIWRKNTKLINNHITYVSNFKAHNTVKGIDSADYSALNLLFNYEKYIHYFKIPLFWRNNVSIEENLNFKISGATSTFPLMIGRGCPVNCSFCGGSLSAQKNLCGRTKSIFRDIDLIVNNMKKAIEVGYKSFVVCFDPTPKEDNFFIELFKKIRSEKIFCGMGFESWGLPTDDFIIEFSKTFDMKTSYIALSPESGSEIIRKLNKGHYYSNEEMKNTIEVMSSYKVPIILYFSIALYKETYENILETESLIKSLKKTFKKDVINYFVLPVQLEPGSPMFENPDKYDLITERKCFKDFYEYHKKPESNPYNYLGYAPKSYESIEKYTEEITSIVCNKFCLLKIKLFGVIESPFISKFACNILHKKYIKKGFGSPAERKYFK